MEGGPDDPRDFDEWATGFRKTFKNVLLPLLIVVGVIVLISLVGGALTGAIN
ncbi:hypothetical protein OG884_18855 [Streptosporangium sp. NBC_01755]|uniref:hypothetical protein n=1 Tax=Streptosporangium sp. NBC_01755 TaxID=2975949 RepID=UPI002DDC0720|nr:hypothetical protein [Streptosporangium sp. NBC_01755]WSD03869.1 hypothetical protein OG884_18855 [Streptosporangium sp. NBC_01755]